jgi:hypothetical protein
MQRKAWFEFHDHPLFPGFLRDLVTDALQAMWNATEIYSPIAPRLGRAITESRATRVIDLCSGGGGPWLQFSREIQGHGGSYPTILLTDKYPSQGSIRHIAGETENRVSFHPEPVNATRIPCELTGFRTIFSTFHHFGPREACAILKSAFDQHQGIGIFEAAKRDLRTMAAAVAVPLLAFRFAPRIRPFRWSRLFWTYCLPVIPLTLWLDGMLSCLRSYSQEDLRELVSDLGSDAYSWEIGEERGGPVAITYLVGCPCEPVQTESTAIPVPQVEEEVRTQEAVPCRLSWQP